MRICLVNVSEWKEGHHDQWFAMMMNSFQKVLHSSTEVEIRSPKPGLGDRVTDFDNAFYDLLNKRQIANVIVEAERENFDAVVVACFGDTGVKEARAVMEIPVFGPGETSILFACLLGRKLGILVPNMPEQISAAEEKITMMGLKERVIPNGIRSDEHPFEEFYTKGLQDPRFVGNATERSARDLVAAGADVIVIGCCGTGPLCTNAGLSKIEVNGRSIPIIDPMMVAMKTAEMAVDLKKGMDLPFTSRRIPTREDVDRVRTHFGLMD